MKPFSRDNLVITAAEAVGLLGGFALFLSGQVLAAVAVLIVGLQVEHTIAFNSGYGRASLERQTLGDLLNPTDTPQLRILLFGGIETGIWLGAFVLGQSLHDAVGAVAVLAPLLALTLLLEHNFTLDAFNRRKFGATVFSLRKGALPFSAVEAVAGAVWIVLSGGAFGGVVPVLGAVVMVGGNLVEHALFAVVQARETHDRLGLIS